MTSGSTNAIGAITPFNLKGGPLMGCRHESTAAASSPPAEKFEYQAEVDFKLNKLPKLFQYSRTVHKVFMCILFEAG